MRLAVYDKEGQQIGIMPDPKQFEEVFDDLKPGYQIGLVSESTDDELLEIRLEKCDQGLRFMCAKSVNGTDRKSNGSKNNKKMSLYGSHPESMVPDAFVAKLLGRDKFEETFGPISEKGRVILFDDHSESLYATHSKQLDTGLADPARYSGKHRMPLRDLLNGKRDRQPESNLPKRRSTQGQTSHTQPKNRERTQRTGTPWKVLEAVRNVSRRFRTLTSKILSIAKSAFPTG